jgi:hypothetical protein
MKNEVADVAIRCLFHFDGGTTGRSSCQVLEWTGSHLAEPTREKLASEYCRSGAFIECPLLRWVERGLVEANRMRSEAEDSSWGEDGETPTPGPCP